MLVTGGSEWLRSTHQAADVFTAVEHERVVLPEPDCIVRASFLVRFSDSKKRRTIKIIGQQQAERGAGWRYGADGKVAGRAQVSSSNASSDEQESEGVLASA